MKLVNVKTGKETYSTLESNKGFTWQSERGEVYSYNTMHYVVFDCLVSGIVDRPAFACAWNDGTPVIVYGCVAVTNLETGETYEVRE